MPVTKAPSGKFRIGSGPAVYATKAAAERAYAAYRAVKHAPQKPSGKRKP